MFKLIATNGSNYMVLDTDDFEVDMVSRKFCIDMVTKGHKIDGIMKLGSEYVFKIVLGVLPRELSVKYQPLRNILLSLQQQGFNIAKYTMKPLPISKSLIEYTNLDYRIFTRVFYIHPRAHLDGVASRSLGLSATSTVKAYSISLGDGATVPTTGFAVYYGNSNDVSEVYLVFE